MSEEILRIEHKLDVIINYLHGMTNVPPADMPKLLPGGGGLTNGTCPITGSVIRYNIDPETGDSKRTDALSSGMPSKQTGIPQPQPWNERSQATSEKVTYEED
tara:strand:+ start:4614 stop:4922 length:309 start_codon:yes stop_codon:yes gene_type:complete